MSVTVQQVAENLRKRQLRGVTDGQARAQRWNEQLPRARAILVEQFGGRVVWLFGSLAMGKLHASSDIDIAVEGLPASSYFLALGRLMSLFGGPVDLVRMEEAVPSLSERIRNEGRIL